VRVRDLLNRAVLMVIWLGVDIWGGGNCLFFSSSSLVGIVRLGIDYPSTGQVALGGSFLHAYFLILQNIIVNEVPCTTITC
jgi:hypothetical protein